MSEGFDFQRACKLAGLEVLDGPEKLTIKTIFDPLNKFNLGTMLFLAMGLMLGYMSIFHSGNLLESVLIGLFGFGFATIAFLALLSQFTNYTSIAGSRLEIRNRLKLTRNKLTPRYKVKMKTRTEYMKLKTLPGSGSYFRIVELWLSDGTRDLQMLDFQVDEKDATLANQLGNHISALVKSRISDL